MIFARTESTGAKSIDGFNNMLVAIGNGSFVTGSGDEIPHSPHRRIRSVRNTRVEQAIEPFYQPENFKLQLIRSTTAPWIVAFIAGVSPPAVRIPIRFIIGRRKCSLFEVLWLGLFIPAN